MTTSSRTWERQLLVWADEGLENEVMAGQPIAAAHLLEDAYDHCERITAQHSRTFYRASALLPREQRRAVRALYAFCRITDDIIDLNSENEAQLRAALAGWRRLALFTPPAGDDPVVVAWAHARARYRIPTRYAEQLIRGVAQDLTTTRYATFDDLVGYCYGVASTVGLMTMHIHGDREAEGEFWSLVVKDRRLAAVEMLLDDIVTPTSGLVTPPRRLELTREQAEARKRAVREKILRLIADLPDYRGPLNVKQYGTLDRGDYRIEKIKPLDLFEFFGFGSYK